MPAGNYSTQTDTLTGYEIYKANPGGAIMNNTTIGLTTPVAAAFTTLTATTGTFTTVTGGAYVDSTAITTASTSVALGATGAVLVGSSTAAKTYALGKPTVGCFKYIRCRSATTSRKTKISVAAASGTINNSKTVITLSNTGDAVTLFGETSTRWGICGAFVAGTTRIATS